MKKLGLLFSSYGPYHLARLQATIQMAEKIGWQIIAIELAAQEEAYDWQREVGDLSIHTIFNSGRLEQQSSSKMSLALWRVLTRLQPDVLAIAGYQPWPMLAALSWCQYHRRPSILMSDSKADDVSRHYWSEFVKGRLVSLYQAALVAGQPHSNYLKQLGFKGLVWFGYDVVDNDYYELGRHQQLPRPIDKPYFLCVSRFLPRKNILMLLQAYHQYQKSRSNPWHLVVCGSGSDKLEILTACKTLGLEKLVCLPGFLQSERLLNYYTHASAFIQPSLQDQWGLVVNEAMAASLPVLASRAIGCFEDLLKEGVNGYGFNPHVPAELSQLMRRLSDNPELCKKMGIAARQTITPWSLDLFANNLLEAAETIHNP